MSEIVAVYVIANEADSIAESIRSVKAYVDRFVIVDSIFDTNPDPATHSSDATLSTAREVLLASPAKPFSYHQSDRKMSEPEARTLALSYVEPGDWAFIIDGDEVLYGDYTPLQIFLSTLRESLLLPDVGAVELGVLTTAINANLMAPDVDSTTFALGPLISTLGYMPRLVRARLGLHYGVEPGMVTPALTTLEGSYDLGLRQEMPLSVGFLINHHTRQSYAGYQNDYIWETAARRPKAGS